MSRMKPSGQHTVPAPGGSSLDSSRRSLRDRMIAELYLRGDYSLRQIADAWGLDKTTVHRIVKRLCRCAGNCTDKNSTP